MMKDPKPISFLQYDDKTDRVINKPYQFDKGLPDSSKKQKK